jgi:hypothetical protein
MGISGKFNKKNPFATLLAYVIKDVFEEASSKDLAKTFGNGLRQMLMVKLQDDNDLFNKVMELKE